MRSAYLIREKDKVALKVLVGEIKENGLLALDRRFLSDPALPPAPKVIIDVTAASFEAIGEEEFRELIELYREHRDKTTGARVAIVTTQDFRKARLYERMVAAASINVIVFTQLDPACTWLGVNTREVQEWISSKRAELLSSAA